MQLFLPDHMGDENAVYPASFYAPVDAMPDPADMHSNLFPSDDDFEG